jgi:hypothetical protein
MMNGDAADRIRNFETINCSWTSISRIYIIIIIRKANASPNPNPKPPSLIYEDGSRYRN